MGDPGCSETQLPVAVAAYDKATLEHAAMSSAFYADQASLLCESCAHCGCSMMKRLTKEDLEEAKANLLATDLVIVEEEPENVKTQIIRLFGSSVQKEITEATIDTEARRHNTSRETQVPPRSDFPAVFADNEFDIELWEYAKSLTVRREEAAKRALQLEKPE